MAKVLMPVLENVSQLVEQYNPIFRQMLDNQKKQQEG
jgi:hypothetical protein